MRRQRRLLCALLVLAAAFPVVANTANTLTFTPPATGSFAVTLDGTDKVGSYSLAIPVSYTSSSSNLFATNGWHITATSTTLKGTSTLKTLATTASKITGFPANPTCTIPTCSLPANTVAYSVAIPAATVAPTPITVYSARANTGAGGNTVTMQVSVAVPANTFADTYKSTMTLAIIEGP
jgi:hypothetical protein